MTVIEIEITVLYSFLSTNQIDNYIAIQLIESNSSLFPIFLHHAMNFTFQHIHVGFVEKQKYNQFRKF